MDFSKLDTQATSKNTFTFSILHPVTGEETGATISVYGSESDSVRKFAANQLRKLEKREFENQRSRKPKHSDLNELRATAIENALVRIADWQNVEWEGKELEFTEENARKLLTACPWLCEQVVENSDNLGNFLKA